MDFRFHGGDDGHPSPSSSCDGYFAEQAMRAGLLGGGDGFPPPPPFGWEAMRREHIREEVRRRVTEGDVCRDAEMEMELAAARRFHAWPEPDAFMPPPPIPMDMLPHVPPPPPMREFGASGGFRRRPRGPAGFEFGQRMLPGGERRWPPPPRRPPPMPELKLELSEIEPSGSSEAPLLEQKVTMTKRRAHAIAVTGAQTKLQKPAGAPSKLQKPAQDWSCALCQVSATSEAGLNEHLQGKKHKVKLAQCGFVNMTDNDKSGMETTTGDKNNAVPDDAPKKINIHVDGAMHEVIQKNNYLWCERCRIRCDSNMAMAGHLQGKKHKELDKVQTQTEAMGSNTKNKEDLAVATENKVNENVPVEVKKEIKKEQDGDLC